MLAPRKNSQFASRYKGFIQARIPAKANSRVIKENDDFHYSCATVNYAMEFAAKNDVEFIMMSCDDKNKINVGTLAVSRYHQLRTFFLVNDSPNYPDHDFPYQDSKIIPSGYLRLSHRRVTAKRPKPRSRSLSDNRSNNKTTRRSRSYSPKRRAQKPSAGFKHDKNGRLHFMYPRTGKLTVVNRATKFYSSTAQTHANDLHKILKPIIAEENKHAVVSVNDGGSDWSLKSIVNLMFYGRLWRDLNLDIFILTSYAAGHSALNMIEHAWSPLSKFLSGVTLPITLENEDKPPCQQSNLNASQLRVKEAAVFDKAINTLNSYWNGRTWDGFNIQSEGIECTGVDPEPYNDYDDVQKLAKCGINAIKSDQSLSLLLKDFLFLLKHAVRRPYQLQFMKCELDCQHCNTHPVRATNAVEQIRKLGGQIMPKWSQLHVGHYATLLEIIHDNEMTGEVLNFAEFDTCPSTSARKNAGDNIVCNRGCRYIFNSKADEERHNLLVHQDERKAERKKEMRQKRKRMDANDGTDTPPIFTCGFLLPDGNKCDFVAPTQYYLRVHREKNEHKLRRHKKNKKHGLIIDT